MPLLRKLQHLLDATRVADFLAPLLIRLYLVPVFWLAGTNKLDGLGPSADTVAWFGNPEWGLGLPMPWLMALLAAWTEVLGAVALLLGAAVRWFALPLMVVMAVAAFVVHWDNGWQAVADPTLCFVGCADAEDARQRLSVARGILREHGDYAWLTGQGSIVVSNNGIEWAATYFLMLLSLFFTGGGRWLSVDDHARRWLMRSDSN